MVAIAQNRTFGTPEGEDDASRTQVVYATSEFQTGSTFKPITLAAALESGMSVRTTYDTPNGLYVDGLDAPEGGYKNDDRRGHGVLDAYGAMRGSVNTYFVQMVADAGVRETASVAQRLGLTSIPDGPQRPRGLADPRRLRELPAPARHGVRDAGRARACAATRC